MRPEVPGLRLRTPFLDFLFGNFETIVVAFARVVRGAGFRGGIKGWLGKCAGGFFQLERAYCWDIKSSGIELVT